MNLPIFACTYHVCAHVFVTGRISAIFAVFDAFPIDLESYLQEIPGILAPKVVLRLMASMLDGLMFLQQHDILHWDFKLNNVMVCPSGSCHIIDLGEALKDLPPSRAFDFRSELSGGNQVFVCFTCSRVLVCDLCTSRYRYASIQPRST